MEVTLHSPLLGSLVTLGNLAVWSGLGASVACVALYWAGMLRAMRRGARPADAGQAEAPPNGKNGKAGRNGKNGKSVAPPTADPLQAKLDLWARRALYVTGGCFVVGAVALMALILNQQYVVGYIHKSSNQHLPFGYRFASFWSNQEGTFFVWGLYNTALAAVFLWKARSDERWVMPFFTLVNVSLFTLLTFMNPFWIPWGEHKAELLRLQAGGEVDQALLSQVLAHFPKAGDAWGFLTHYFGWGTYVRIPDGRGLNEQLQNFWMVIHPPTLFVGYSSMMIPASFALGALMKRDYDSWAVRAAPWLGFSWAVLGLGIFLGAYWAYETLGWGGYWSWDPVENSSILPWLVGTALLHGLVAQRARGNFKQANLFLGVMAGFAVLLGSFMVRSGVLDGVSVHTFATPQKTVFFTLLVAMGLWLVLGTGVWLWRFRAIQSAIAYESVWERHFGFFLGLIVLSTTALVVMLGVTFPVWRPWFPDPGDKPNLPYTFYNQTLLPVVFFMVLLMTVTPLLPWRRTKERPHRPFTLVVLGLCTACTLFFLFAAVWAWQGGFKTQNDPAYLAVGLVIAVSLVANGTCLVRSARGGFLQTAPWLAHLGFLVMLAGIVWTSRWNTVTSFTMVPLNEPVRAYGYEVVWTGQRPGARETDRDRMLFTVRKGNWSTEIAPKFFVSKISEQPMAWPSILPAGFLFLDDLYVEPSGVDNSGTVSFKDVGKEEPKGIAVQYDRDSPTDNVAVQLLSLDMSEFQKELQKPSGKPFHIWAEVRVTVNGQERTVRLARRLHPDGSPTEAIPVSLDGLQQPQPYRLTFENTNLDPADLKVDINLTPTVPVRHGYFQVLYVPGIRVLWIGAYLMIFGAFLAYWRRSKLAARWTPPRVRPGEAVPGRDEPEAEPATETAGVR